MDASELELCKTQLAQATTALKSDPNNADLENLKSELENLISLTQSLVESTDDPPQPQETGTADAEHSQPQPIRPRGKEKAQFSTGQQVLARYSADRQFYPARIAAVAGDPTNPTYTVVYKGYGNTEMLTGTALKSLQPSSNASDPPPPPPSDLSETAGTSAPSPPPPTTSTHGHPSPPQPTSSSNAPILASSSAPPPPPASPPPHPSVGAPIDEATRKKYRNEKKLARREEKSAIQSSKAASWQKFASSATKKKQLKSSIFHTSDDPYAKVGVTKSSSSNSGW